MNEIHFIKNLHFDYKLLCNSHGKGAEVFMRQGDLDGACAVYSLMMMLVIHQKIARHELETRDSSQGYTSNMRLQDQFLYGIRGLYRDGYYFDTLCDELASCFKSKATASSYTTMSRHRGRVEKAELHNIIMKTIDEGNPVELGFTYKGNVGGHAVVAIGYQRYKSRMLLFCLDPGFDLPRNAFWNTIIDVELEFNKRVTYTDSASFPDNSQSNISLDEILVID